jgi:hypothetical protein
MYPVMKDVSHKSGRDAQDNYRGKTKRFNWVMSDKLEDLDFADGICLPSHDFVRKERKLRNLESEERIAGSQNNCKKARLIKINAKSDIRFKMNENYIEELNFHKWAVR